MENMHPVDSLFREKLKDKGNVFQEAHWEMLLKELESDKRRSILYYWRYAAAVAVFAIGTWYFIGNGFDKNVIVNTTPVPVKTETPQEDLALNTPVVESDEAREEKVKGISTENIEKETVKKISTAQSSQTKASEVGKISTKEPTKNTLREVIKKVENASAIAAISSDKKQNTSSVNESVFSNPSRENLPKGSGFDDVALADTFNNKEESGFVNNKSSQTEMNLKVDDRAMQVDLVEMETSVATTPNANAVPREKTAQLDKLNPLGFEFDLDESTAAIPEKTFTYPKQKKSFLSVGPAFIMGWNTDRASSLKSIENTFQMPGIEMAYHFNDHWDLGVGAFYGKKRYTVDGASFTIDASQSANSVIEVYNDIVEVPLSLGYTFGKDKSRVRPFVRAGISMARFNGTVESSVAYNPYETTLIDVTPEPEVFTDDLIGFDDSEEPIGPSGPAGPGGPQGGNIDITQGGPMEPSPTPEEEIASNEPIEPVYQEVLVYGTYGNSPMADRGRLLFDKKVNKMLPFYGMAAAGVKVRLSERLSLLLSGQYKMTRKREPDFSALSAADNFSILDQSDDGLVSQNGFQNLSGLLSLRYNWR